MLNSTRRRSSASTHHFSHSHNNTTADGSDLKSTESANTIPAQTTHTPTANINTRFSVHVTTANEPGNTTVAKPTNDTVSGDNSKKSSAQKTPLPRVQILPLNDQAEVLNGSSPTAGESSFQFHLHRNNTPYGSLDDVAIESASESESEAGGVNPLLRLAQLHRSQETAKHSKSNVHLDSHEVGPDSEVCRKFHISTPKNYRPFESIPKDFLSIVKPNSLYQSREIPLIKSGKTVDAELDFDDEAMTDKEKLRALHKIKPLFTYTVPKFMQSPSLETLSLIEIGVCCAGCGVNLTNTNTSAHYITSSNASVHSSAATTKASRSKSFSGSVKQGLDCEDCQAMYCSLSCKKEFRHLHKNLKHPSLKFRARILSSVSVNSKVGVDTVASKQKSTPDAVPSGKNDHVMAKVQEEENEDEDEDEDEDEEDEGPPPPTNYRVWNTKMKEFVKCHFWNSGYNLIMYLVNIEHMHSGSGEAGEPKEALQLIREELLSVSIINETSSGKIVEVPEEDKDDDLESSSAIADEEEDDNNDDYMEGTERDVLKMLHEGFALFCEMFPKYQTKKYRLEFNDFKMLIDSLEYNSSIVDRVPESYGMCIPVLSMFQHSCRPNCYLVKQVDNSPLGDSSKGGSGTKTSSLSYAVKPIRYIEEGELLTFSYVSEKKNVDERNAELEYKFGIEKCDCDQCFQDRNKRFESLYELSMSSLDLNKTNVLPMASRRKSSMKSTSRAKSFNGRRPSVRFDGKVVALNI